MQRATENIKQLKFHDDISYQVMSVNDIDETVQCILTTFTLGEPKCKALGITRADGIAYAIIYSTKASHEGLSIIARDAETSRIAGFVINSDFMSDPPEGIEKISPKLYPIAAITDSLEKKYKEKNPTAKGELLYQLLLGVMPAYSKRNVGFTLGSLSWDLARDKGFRGVIGECTGPVSQHLAIQKADYREVASINYGEFVYCGQKIFQHVTDCKSTKLLLKML
ncbi:MAG TPA: hypothetical protein PK573_00785 [Spirochaetota bacterium]|nr:hypothetical protein [Spirochaetota bacterium]HRZ28353.1 hypothetical protein [Spirochaetota bacterium]HSA13159.1 hypothetical protein [Spirochaetota bacterium]